MAYFLGVLAYSANIFFLFHAIRTGRDRYWLFVLVMAPGVGSFAYFLMEFLPEIRSSRAGRVVATTVADKLDPERHLRILRERFEIAETVDNRRLLAEELVRLGRAGDAEQILRPALAGLHAHDPALLLLLAEIEFRRGNPQACLDALDRLKEHNPDFQSREGHMLYARALQSLGRSEEAIAEYSSLIGYALGPEAQVRLGLLLAQGGRAVEARKCFTEAVRIYARSRRRMEPEARQWLETAERELLR